MIKCKHDWQHVCHKTRMGWMRETEWCTLCGTLRHSTIESGKYDYEYPKSRQQHSHRSNRPGKKVLKKFAKDVINFNKTR